MVDYKHIKEMGLLRSFAIYISAAILMYVQTRFTIPYLSNLTNQETILFWFIVAGLGIFTPLIVLGLILLKCEGYKLNTKTLVERLRFAKITKKDLLYSFIGLVFVGILSGIIMVLLTYLFGKFNHTPPFMIFSPLTPNRYWLLLVWLPYWLLNIFGEEFLWRGVMLPRQELAFGKSTWFIHGIGWGIFHIAFGWQLLITLLPLIFIQSYLVQRTKNTWVGIIMHGGLNGPSFILISFGII